MSRVNSLKNILVCLYGSTGSLWNRFGNVIAFDEINRLSGEVLIKTKDIVQELGYEMVYADLMKSYTKHGLKWISCGILLAIFVKILHRISGNH